jgi:hypothetical protein
MFYTLLSFFCAELRVHAISKATAVSKYVKME